MRKRSFRIGKFLEIRLENNNTNVYVNNEIFNQCKYLLLNLDKNNLKKYDSIKSIDEAAMVLENPLGRKEININPKTEYWAHCSNLQAWFDNEYDTRLLHRNLAFPLLKKLTNAGDLKAKKVFKEEIAKRFKSKFPPVSLFLIKQKYLKYFTREEMQGLIDDEDLTYYTKLLENEYIDIETIKKIFGKNLCQKQVIEFLLKRNYFDELTTEELEMILIKQENINTFFYIWRKEKDKSARIKLLNKYSYKLEQFSKSLNKYSNKKKSLKEKIKEGEKLELLYLFLSKQKIPEVLDNLVYKL